MGTYHVTWEIDVDADSPLEAARQARELQRPGSSANVFDVLEHDSEGDIERFDLDEHGES